MSSWLGFRVKEEAHFVAESGIGKIPEGDRRAEKLRTQV